MTETTTPEITREELEQLLEAVLLANLREELDLAALYEFAFGDEFGGLKAIRDELIIQELSARITIERASVTGLARQLGVDKATIYRWLRGTGVRYQYRTPVFRGTRPTTLASQEEAWLRQRGGETYAEIARAMEVSIPTVARWIGAERKSREAADA
ncbi:hypothetical protein [Microbacterium sp. Leaf436]|uniref:hypothetical protein n=1 Tax=Microbacterium sp. Leaf436 TaxID=1736377 RepID=UPI000701AFCC|nr:hypothetical protein [Microbacterium sp. Leaf436]KQT71995.1 hypothetical protein ASG45_13535 [Microbacterium sp. Leaf436]